MARELGAVVVRDAGPGPRRQRGEHRQLGPDAFVGGPVRDDGGHEERGGDEMLDSLSGRSRHRGEVFEGAAQACGGVVRAVRA